MSSNRIVQFKISPKYFIVSCTHFFTYSKSNTTLSVRVFVGSRAVCAEELQPLLTEAKGSLKTKLLPQSGLIIQNTNEEASKVFSLFHTEQCQKYTGRFDLFLRLLTCFTKTSRYHHSSVNLSFHFKIPTV